MERFEERNFLSVVQSRNKHKLFKPGFLAAVFPYFLLPKASLRLSQKSHELKEKEKGEKEGEHGCLGTAIQLAEIEEQSCDFCCSYTRLTLLYFSLKFSQEI